MPSKPKKELQRLLTTGPWEWPEGSGALILQVLEDAKAAEVDRLAAAELAGEVAVIDDELAAALLAIVRAGDAPEELRGRAAISLGPILEMADLDGFDDDDALPISEPTFKTIQATLREVQKDDAAPKLVRRRCLEASVRAPDDWHKKAIRAAHDSDDDAWKLTGVFCMQYVRGFEPEILAALDSADAEVRYEAVRAAGAWGLRKAWAPIAAIVRARDTAKPLRLAAIEAAAAIRPHAAEELLGGLAESRDPEIAQAVEEALLMAGGELGEDDER